MLVFTHIPMICLSGSIAPRYEGILWHRHLTWEEPSKITSRLPENYGELCNWGKGYAWSELFYGYLSHTNKNFAKWKMFDKATAQSYWEVKIIHRWEKKKPNYCFLPSFLTPSHLYTVIYYRFCWILLANSFTHENLPRSVHVLPFDSSL